MLKDEPAFEWNEVKNRINTRKHGVSFEEAQYAFLDPKYLISEDPDHSYIEDRYYCYGKDEASKSILTVRFTFRFGRIRIIGAGYWRKGRKIYEQENQIH
jgi:uncharacterized DUF497 family protein